MGTKLVWSITLEASKPNNYAKETINISASFSHEAVQKAKEIFAQKYRFDISEISIIKTDGAKVDDF